MLLSTYDLTSAFATIHAFPSTTDKTDHFAHIRRDTGCAYSQMLFFDDETRNIEAVGRMGVTAVHVPDQDQGLTLALLTAGLSAFAKAQEDYAGY